MAVAGGEVAGFACYRPDHVKKVGEIGLNAVHPAHAWQGLGTRIYLFVLERMREQGMTVATVSTGGDASHAPARRAYEKAGFGPGLPSVTLYRSL